MIMISEAIITARSYLNKWYEYRVIANDYESLTYFSPTELVNTNEARIEIKYRLISFITDKKTHTSSLKLMSNELISLCTDGFEKYFETEKSLEEVKHIFQMMCFTMQSQWFEENWK